jgi:ABC-type transporter Mla subunit MlaD
MGHDTILTAFVIIAALALVAQAGIFYGIFEALRQLQRTVQQSASGKRLDEVAQTVTDFLSESREPVRTIITNLAGISTMLRERSMQVDAVVAELVDRSRAQIIRVDQMVTGMVEKVGTTADAMERGVLAPLNEASAVIKGVQKGLDVLFSRRRAATASESTHDDQMFI